MYPVHHRTAALSTALIFAALPIMSAQASDSSSEEWQDNSLTYLYGRHFEINPAVQQTVTWESESGWSFGDVYFYIDVTKYNGDNDDDNGKSSHYGEFSPRFSFGKLLDKDFSSGLISDVLLATRYDYGEGDVETYLVGIGFDLDVSGFDELQLNLYRRIPNDDRDGKTVQLSSHWRKTIPLGSTDLLFDGNLDWNLSSDGSYHTNLHINPQLKLDVGQLLGGDAGTLYMGAEYSYWRSKYGIENSASLDTNESVTSMIIQYHF